MQALDPSISNAIVRLKSEYVRAAKGRTFLSEIVPDAFSEVLPIESSALQSLHNFAKANDMYSNPRPQTVGGVPCSIYETDINRYWLGSKKHDASYQPFYPTWLVSAYALALGAKSLGYNEIVDIGSGDGRIAYCGSIVGLKSFGIELDQDLVSLQDRIVNSTGVKYAIKNADATRFDYAKLGLSRPIFFISALPEVGEMLAYSVLRNIVSNPELKFSSGFNFMGSHDLKALARDQTGWGWGGVLSEFGLKLDGVITLPTFWTTEQPVDTAYLYSSTA